MPPVAAPHTADNRLIRYARMPIGSFEKRYDSRT